LVRLLGLETKKTALAVEGSVTIVLLRLFSVLKLFSELKALAAFVSGASSPIEARIPIHIFLSLLIKKTS
jgi:hypothetical protein